MALARSTPPRYKADMQTRLERDYRFEAAHFLPKVPPGHKCGKLHGHSYLVRVAIEGEIGAATGWLLDFADLDVVVKPLIERLDHQTLNEVAGLATPTSELLAVWFFDQLRGKVPVTEIMVSETVSSRCYYRGA